MITLKDTDLIAVSGPRACYLHPRDPNKVIKIVRKKPLFQKQNANHQEWRHYNYLLKHHGRLDFVNTCYGFAETNLGEGLIWRCVRDDNGDISSTVTHILENREQYDLGAVHKELINFCQFIIQHNIQLFDLNPLNVLIKVRSDGSYKAVSADIKGRYANYELIPISTYIPFFSRKKLKIRTHELLIRLQDALNSDR